MRLPILAAVSGALVTGLVGVGQLHLATALLLVCAVAAAAIAATDAAGRAFGLQPRGLRRMRHLVIVAAVMTVALELLLRANGTYTSYLERGTGGSFFATYRAGFAVPRASWLHVYTPHIEVRYDNAEFTSVTTTNALGLCEREIPAAKPAGEYRIVALGDSFTEGVGAPSGSSWPRALEAYLNEKQPSRRTAVYNAGIGGSDPWYEYVLLRDVLLAHAPDLVVVAINSSDINDAMIRGGQERFQTDGTTRFAHQPPAWEWLYGISHLARHIVHDVLQYDYLFIKKRDLAKTRGRAVEDIVAAVRALHALSLERRIPLLVVTHPNGNEARYNQYDQSTRHLVATLGGIAGLRTVDLLAGWQPAIAERGADTFFWAIDGHNTGAGYAVFAQLVGDHLLQTSLVAGILERSCPACRP